MNSESLTIGFVLDDGLDSTDGVQQYILTLGRWFSKNGHNVHYLVGQTSRQDIKNVHSLSRNIKTRFNHNVGSTPLPAKSKAIKRLLEEQKFDVLHVQMPYSPFMAGRVMKLAGPKTAVIATFHILPYGLKERLGNRLLAEFSKRGRRRIDALMSVSSAAASYAKQNLSIPSIVVPNCIDYKSFRKSHDKTEAKSSRFRIVYVGRLVARKGVKPLLSAVSLLPKSQLDKLEVAVAGKGPMKDELERYVKSRGISRVIDFKGFVSEAEKIKLLANADIAVFPSMSGESFGIVLLEAMASGSGVVLAGDNPGYRSVLGQVDGAIINPRDSAGFAKAIEKLMTRPELRRDIHRQQAALVKQYDVDVVAPKVLSVYRKSLGKR